MAYNKQANIKQILLAISSFNCDSIEIFLFSFLFAIAAF